LQRFESLLLTPATILGTPAEAGLNQKNAQWRSQKSFKPCAEFCNLFVGHNTRIQLTTSSIEYRVSKREVIYATL
jgi:hypothetical protein